jgi:TetR/AcrR family transcriptional regulator, cholesterol catabolism regulator
VTAAGRGRIDPGAPAIRRRRPGHERRAEILTVATGVFHRKGYEASSLQDIADALDIRKASLFYYFKSKDDLLHEVLITIIRKGIENSRRIMALGGDPLTILWRLVHGHVLHLCANLEETAVFLHERKSLPRERRADIQADDQTYFALFMGAIEEGLAAGLVRSDVEPRLAALNILGAANWTYTWYRRTGAYSPQCIAEQNATISINGLASRRALLTWRPPA